MNNRRDYPDTSEDIYIQFKGPVVEYIENIMDQEFYESPRDFILDLIRQHKKSRNRAET